jgi:hypothetical protein
VDLPTRFASLQILFHQASLPGAPELAFNSKRYNFIHSAVPQIRD